MKGQKASRPSINIQDSAAAASWRGNSTATATAEVQSRRETIDVSFSVARIRYVVIYNVVEECQIFSFRDLASLRRHSIDYTRGFYPCRSIFDQQFIYLFQKVDARVGRMLLVIFWRWLLGIHGWCSLSSEGDSLDLFMITVGRRYFHQLVNSA